MKRLLILLILLWAVPALAVNPTDSRAEYAFATVSGGTDNAMDSVDGANLSGGEVCTIRYEFGTESKRVKFSYILDENCTETSDDFEFVAPDNNPGTKLWVIDSYPRPVSDTDPASLFPSGWTVIWDELP